MTSTAALGALGAGSIFLYAGIKGYSVPHAIQSILSGKSPAGAPVANPINATAVSTALDNASSYPSNADIGPVAGGGSAQAILQQTAAAYGWTGAQWQALQNVELAEAGFNPQATNPTTGAYGLAQALGHGQGAATQGTVTNQYGGYGVSDAVAQAANSGDAAAQAAWMCAYIQATYGNPVNAWAHEQANHWY